MMRKLATLALTLSSFQVLTAVEPMPSGQLLLEMQKLNTLGSVLLVAAHPDDENTRLITYLANELKVDTTYLSLTRGDGGQNLLGTDLSEKLGIMQPGPTGSHRYVLDFSNIIMGFESMQAAVLREEKMVLNQ